MARFKFHKLAAVAVLIGFSAWIATGEFSSVGSAQQEGESAPSQTEVAPAPIRTVAVVTPPRVQHARVIRVSGQTQAERRAVMTTRAAGVIVELPHRQGDLVKKGDLILKLDAAEKIAAVDTAEALLSQRQAEWEATERLAKGGSVAKLQLEAARSALAAARSQLRAAIAEVERTEVRAPFDGVVDRVEVELGSSIASGGQVATILDLDPILGKGEVSERDLGYLENGEEADVRLVSGEVVKGTLRYISRAASEATRTFPIEVAIPNADRRISAGMTAEIVLRTIPVDAVVLPRSVVTLSGSGDLGIRAVDKNNEVTFHPIDLVDDTPTGLVLGGIPAEARVIVAGQDLVVEGEKVNPVEADQETIKKLVGEVTGGTQ